MNHIYVIPFILVIAIIYFVSDKGDLKILKFISKLLIIVGFVIFIIEYLKYLGIDIISNVINFFIH